ncbi:MAG: hypothetical protein LUO82_03970 [Methanomicrobiales archaeon]|nr:hypothetical protein [Methanomicrobiales archaeon]
MKCPVCGEDCVESAHEIINQLPSIFAPCPKCSARTLDKSAPLKEQSFREPCACGKRYIDETFAHIYTIFVEEGILSSSSPLKDVGYPLTHPGFAMATAPYLKKDTLVLLSPVVSSTAAERVVTEVPEIKGVVKCGRFVPGALDVDLAKEPQTYELLAGCDVRADVFYTQTHPVVTYKQQSRLHIEFPRGYDPKIVSVGAHIKHLLPRIFVDACCGAGTLGILGGMLGVPRVFLNDAWYAAAFWAGFNLKVNSEFLLVGSVHILKEYQDMENQPVRKEPELIAEAHGDQHIEVYHGDFRRLSQVLPRERGILTVIDLFEKGNSEFNKKLEQEWRGQVGGDVFIP